MTLSFISESQSGSFSAEVGQRLSGHLPTSLQTLGAITRIVILKRIYSEFQKYPNWPFLNLKV